jgi:hypothetical protein
MPAMSGGSRREPEMGITWRFFRGDDRYWHWQQLNDYREVVESSRQALESYDDCVHDARQSGYVEVVVQPRRKRGG